MSIIYQLLIIAVPLIFCSLIIIVFFNQKKIAPFLHRMFQFSFVILLAFFCYQISLETFTENGSYSNSKNSYSYTSSHHNSGYNVPVNINLSFGQKKVYNHESKEGTHSFTKYTDRTKNHFEKSDFQKTMLSKANLNQYQLDSIFKFSSDVEVQGGKLVIGGPNHESSILKTNTTSFQTKGYLNIKSSNLFFKFCQILKSYLPLLFTIGIFYILMLIFKLLKEDLTFSKSLSKKIKSLGLLLIIWQLTSFILCLIFNYYYSYVSFEKSNSLKGINLSVNPRIEFDATLFIIGMCLIVLNILLQKGTNIKQENDLTI